MGGKVSGLVGRDAELARVADQLAQAMAGNGRWVIVEGEAGIGKSRLVEEVVSRAPRGAMICAAAGDDIERERPFGLIAQALGLVRSSPHEDQRRLGRLLLGEERSAEDARGVRFRLIEETLDLVDRLASERPVVLALDDLHWADVETVSVLRGLARLLADLPLLLLGTMRSTPRGPDLHALLERLEGGGGERVPLLPLNDTAAVALASQLVRAVPDESLIKEIRRAGGNPLFVTETIAALERSNGILVERGAARVVDPGNGEGLSDAVLRRLTGVSLQTERALQLASVLGSMFSAAELSSVMGISAAELSEHVAEGIRSGVLEEAGERLAFRHDVVREAIYGKIPLSVRKALHKQTADALIASGASAGRIAAHMSLGAEPGDVEAVRWLREAARSPLLSPSVVVDTLQRAIDLGGAGYPEREELLAEKVVALNWSGRLTEAAREGEALLRMATSPTVVTLARMGLAQTLLLGARYRDAIPALEAALESSRDQPSQAAILANLAMASTTSYGSATERYAQRAIELGGLSGNEAAVVVGYIALTQEAVRVGDVAGAVRHWRNAREASQAGPLQGELAFGPIWMPTLSIYLADVDRTEARELEIDLVAREAEQTRTQWAMYRRHMAVIRWQFLAGEWDDAAAEAEAGLAFAAENHIEYGMLIVRPALGIILLHRGDLAGAEAVSLTEQQLRDRGPNVYAGEGLMVLALIHEAKGEMVFAVEVAGRAERAGREYLGRYPALACEYARLALAAGHREKGSAVLARLDDVAGTLDIPSARGSALRARGLIEDDGSLLLRAVEEFRNSPRLPDLAAACEDAGFTAATEDGALIEEALGLYEGLGAVRDIARVEARLRERGIRRGVKGRRSRPAMGWESLTKTENRIVSLVAEGLRNPDIAGRMFISRNTVQTHLSHVFTKLGVSSRVELAVLAAEHAQTPANH